MNKKTPDILSYGAKALCLKRSGRVLDLLLNKVEQFFFRLALRRRENRIGKEFDRVLSLEIDCLLILIERVKK
jgi:hypothetical protein